MTSRKSLMVLAEMLAMMMGGFILFNFAFILAFGVHTVVSISVMHRILSWHFVYICVIAVLSGFILKLRLSTYIKATYLTLPLMVILVEIALNLYQHPFWVVLLSFIFLSSTLVYIIKKKLPWQFYFSVFYVGILGIVIMVFNIQI